jgi:hypothetical protein
VFINSLEYLSQVQAHQVVLPPQLQDVYQEVEKEAQALDEVVEDQASLAQALVQACQDGRQVERLVAQEVQAHKVLLAPLHAQAQQELVEGSPQAQCRVVEAQAPLAQALEHEEQVLWKVSQVLEEKVRKNHPVFRQMLTFSAPQTWPVPLRIDSAMLPHALALLVAALCMLRRLNVIPAAGTSTPSRTTAAASGCLPGGGKGSTSTRRGGGGPSFTGAQSGTRRAVTLAG